MGEVLCRATGGSFQLFFNNRPEVHGVFQVAECITFEMRYTMKVPHHSGKKC